MRRFLIEMPPIRSILQIRGNTTNQNKSCYSFEFFIFTTCRIYNLLFSKQAIKSYINNFLFIFYPGRNNRFYTFIFIKAFRRLPKLIK